MVGSDGIVSRRQRLASVFLGLPASNLIARQYTSGRKRRAVPQTAREITQRVQHLSYKHEDPSSEPQDSGKAGCGCTHPAVTWKMGTEPLKLLADVHSRDSGRPCLKVKGEDLLCSLFCFCYDRKPNTKQMRVGVPDLWVENPEVGVEQPFTGVPYQMT